MFGVYAVFWIWNHPRFNSDFGFLFPERKGSVYITNRWMNWFEDGFMLNVKSKKTLNINIPDYPDPNCEVNCKTSNDRGFMYENATGRANWSTLKKTKSSKYPLVVRLDLDVISSSGDLVTIYESQFLSESCPLLKSKPSKIQFVKISSHERSNALYEMLFNLQKTEFCIVVSYF